MTLKEAWELIKDNEGPLSETEKTNIKDVIVVPAPREDNLLQDFKEKVGELLNSGNILGEIDYDSICKSYGHIGFMIMLIKNNENGKVVFTSHHLVKVRH